MNMKIDELEMQDRGPYQFDLFKHPDTVDSRLGPFSIELMVEMNETPNQEMADAMQTLMERFEANSDAIAEIVFKEYRTVAEAAPDWMKDCGVPLNLSVDDLAPYLEVRSITVSNDLDDAEDHYHPRVYMSPQWDGEHGLYLKLQGNGIERVDC